MIYVFTSATKGYLPKVAVLGESIAKHHPEFHFVVAMADTLPSGFRLDDFKAKTILTVEQLIKSRGWIFQHTIVELSTAIKPFVLKRLLQQADCEAVAYFDPDIELYSRLDDLFAEFTRSSILLVPHLTKPDISDVPVNELSTLQHGIYNLGFLGVKNDAEGNRFCDWWASRLEQYCFDDRSNGLFTDQKWADMVPAIFDQVAIVRSSRFDVASWNVATREVKRDGESIIVDGEPLGFYHFSGFDGGVNGFALERAGVARDSPLWDLDEQYRRRVGAQSGAPWAYERFSNGRPILAEDRWRYRKSVRLQSAFPDPFESRSKSYYRWLRGHRSLRKRCDLAIETLLPQRSRRRRVYELWQSGMKILVDQGVGEFFRESTRYLLSKTH